MAHINTTLRGALMTALAFSTAPALAQSGGDFGGSFETDAPPAVILPAPGEQPAPTEDNFGGSFGSGGGATPPPPPQPDGGDKDTLPPVVDDGGNFGGSDFGSGGDTPQPPPPPPEPQPEPQPPAPPQPEPQPPVPPEPGPAPDPVQPSGIDPQIQAFELRDFGVPATSNLRSDQFHAPTPTSIDGAQVVTTAVLSQALNAGAKVVMIDVLGGNYSLPGALIAPALASGGDFNDRVQQQASQWLGQITNGNPGQTIVIYCSDPNCWLSYNASLRAVAAGYTQVYWYRGGLQAWQMAGQKLIPSGF